MEMKKENMNKRKYPIIVSACLILIFAIILGSTLTGCGFIDKLFNKDKVVNTDSTNVTDEDTLRKALASTDTNVITLTEDITITEELVVNGTKTLKGDKSIIISLKAIGKSANVVSVATGGNLILDGATIDGNGVANGIGVKTGGTFKGVSGSVVYGYPYCMTIAGEADLEGISIERAMHTGIYVEYGGKANLTGGVVKDNIYGIAVASQAYMSISGNAQVIDSTATLVNNYGEMVVTAGTYKGGADNAFTNQGELTITGTADSKIEICDTERSAIVSKKNSKITVSNLYIHDVGLHGISVEKKTQAEVLDCVIERTGASSVYINSANVVMKNSSITEGASYGIYAQKNSDVTLENITIKNIGSRGITNDGSKLRGKDFLIEGTGKNGVYTTGEDAVTNIENVQILRPESNALAVVSGKILVKNLVIEEPKNEGLYIGLDAQLEAEKVSINKSGMNSVANNGGHVKLRDIEIKLSNNIAIKSTDEGTISVEGAKIIDSASHAVCVEKNSIVKVIDCEIDKTGKSSAYVANSKLTMEDTQISNAPNYAVYAKECLKESNQGVFLDRITISNSNDRGIGNSGAWVVIKNTTISNTKGAAVYTEKEASITNIHELTVNEPGTSGLGLVGGTVTARNVTIRNSVNEGVNVGKGANVRLDNVTVVKPGKFGAANYGGTLQITVDTKFNPENVLGNGLIVKDAGLSALYCDGVGKTTATGVVIENAGQHAICVKNGSTISIKNSKIDKTAKSSVYVIGSKAVLTDVSIKNAPNYAVYATDCSKDKDQGAFLEGVTIDKTDNRGVGNVGAWVVIKNSKISNTKGAAVYSEKDASITNIHALTVDNPGTSGLGIVGGTVTARNMTVNNPANEGVNVSKGANVRLDNVTVVKPGKFGAANYGGTLQITVDTKFNPENVLGNGLIVKDAGLSALYCDGVGKTTATGVVIENAGQHAICVKNGSTISIKNSKIDKTAKSSVYVIGSKAVLTDVSIKNAPNYAVYATDCSKDKDQGAFLEGVTIDKTDNRGVGNVGAWVVIKNSKISNTKGAAVYTEKEASTTNIHELTVNNAGSCGLGLLGGTITARNLTIDKTTNEGINIGEGVYVRLDDTVIKNAGTHGIGNYGGTLKITVDTTFNPENDNQNGLTIDGAGNYGILSNKSSAINGVGVTIKNVTKDGIRISEANLNLEGAQFSNVGLDGNSYAIYSYSSGTLTKENVVLEKVTIKDAGYRGIGNFGSWIKISDITVNGSEGAAIFSDRANSITYLNGAEINNAGSSGLAVVGGKVVADAVQITNAKYEGVNVDEGAEVTLTNTRISKSGTSGIDVESDANVSLDNVTISESKKNGIYNYGVVTITALENGNGVTVDGVEETCGIYNRGTSEVSGNNITIRNVAKDGIYIEADSKVTLDGVVITGTGRDGISTSGTLTITSENGANKGATITEVGQHGIVIQGGVTTATGINVIDSAKKGIYIYKTANVTIDGITVTNSGEQGMQFAGSATGTISDFAVNKAGSSGVYVIGADANITLDNGTISEAENGIYLENSKVTTTDVVVDKSEVAGVYVKEGTTTSLQGVNITNSVKDGVYVEKSAVIDMDKVKITNSGDNGILNYGTVNVTGDNSIVIDGVTKTCGIYNRGTAKLEAKNIKISDVGKDGILGDSTTTITLDNAVITKAGRDGISTSGTLTITSENGANKGATITEAGQHGIVIQGGLTTAEEINVTDSAKKGIYILKTANVTINGITVANAGEQGMQFAGTATGIISDFAVNKAGASGVYVIGADANVTLNNGTISEAENGIYLENGKVTTTDVVVDGAKVAGVYVKEGTTTSLQGVNIKNSVKDGVYVEKSATVEMDAVEITNSGDNGILNYGTVKVTGDNSIVIDGVTSTCGIYNKGTAKLIAKNIKISNVAKDGILGDSTTTITLDNVVITKAGRDGISTSGNLTITSENDANKGATITEAGQHGIVIQGGITKADEITITDSAKKGIYIFKTANVTIDGITVTNSGEQGMQFAGTATGTISNFAVNKAGASGVYVIGENADIILSDGTISESENGICLENSKLTTQEVVVDGAKVAGVYVKEGDITSSLQGLSITNSVKDGVYVEKSATVELDAIEITNSGDNGILNYGTVNITGDNSIVIDGVTKTCGIYNKGIAKLIAKNIKISNVEKDGILGESTTDITLENVVITDAHRQAISTSGNLTIDGATISTTETCDVHPEKQADILIQGGVTNAKDITIINSVKKGIYVKTATFTIDGITVTNPGNQGMQFSGKATGKVTDFTVSKTGNAAVYITDAETDITLENGSVSEVPYGIYLENSKASVKNVNVQTCTNNGIFVKNANLTADASMVEGSVNAGIHVEGANASVNLKEMTVTESGTNGLEIVGGTTVADDMLFTGTTQYNIHVTGGNLTLTDTDIANASSSGVYVNGADANVEIKAVDENAVNISKPTTYGLEVLAGTVTANKLNISEAGVDGIYVAAGATVNLDAVVIEDPKQNGIQNYGTVNVVQGNGLTIRGAKETCGIYNRDNALLTGKNIVIEDIAKDGILGEAGTSITLDNLVITDAGREGISTSGNLTITSENDANKGATITNAGEHGILIQGGVTNAEDITITGSVKKGLYVKAATVTIDGITVTNPGNQGMQFSGKAKGTVSNFVVITSNATQNASVYISDADTNINFVNGTIDSYKQGIYLDSNTTATATDVSVTRLTGSTSPLVVVNTGATFTLNETETNKSVLDGNGLDARGVEVKGTFILNGGTITGNKVSSIDRQAAGVLVDANAIFTMNGGSVTGNEITNATVANGYAGAGVYVGEDATFTLAGGTISDNIANASGKNTYGAGISVVNGTLNMTGGSVLSNDIIESSSASSYGAGVALSGATFTMSGGEISDNGNAAVNAGGAVSINASSEFNFTGGKIQRNNANNGGAIHANSGSMIMGGTALLGGETAADGNVAKENGGAIWFANSFNFTMDGGKIACNTATKKAGALYLQKSSTVELNDGEISGNISTTRTHGIDSDSTSSKSNVIISAGFELLDTIYTTNITVTDNR